MLIFTLAGGVWADRLSRRTLMIGSHLVRLGSQGLLGVLLVSGHATIWELVVLQVVYGAATAFFRPALSGIVPQLVRPERLQEANALLFGWRGIAAFVGPAIAGVLLVALSPGWAILGDSASFALAAILLARLRLPALPVSVPTGFIRELADGWREFVSRRWVWASVVSMAITQLVWLTSLTVLGALVAQRSLGGSSAWALISAAFGAGAFLGNFIGLHIRPRRPLFVANALTVGCAPSLFLLGIAAPAPLIAAAELYSGVAVGIASLLWETTLQEQVPQASYGRVSAYDTMGSIVLRPLGLAIIGPVASVAGIRATLIGAGVITAVNPLLLLLVRDIRETRSRGHAAAKVERLVADPALLPDEQPVP